MKITCPKCQHKFDIAGVQRLGGRKGSPITVTDVIDALRKAKNIYQAAERLGCSRGLIYQRLKAIGKKPKEIISAVHPCAGSKTGRQAPE